MTQHHESPPSYAGLLEALHPGLGPIVAEIVRDVAGPGDDLEALAVSTRVAVESTIAALLRAEELSGAELSRLRLAGSRAARDGESLHRLLDRYLTSGWVLWSAATRRPSGSRAAVAALGTALLKAGDAAAAALGEGYADAEREIAARTGAARREFLDELLDLPSGDPAATARITRRAAHFGLASSETFQVLVCGVGREIEDEGPEILRVALALDRPGRSGGDRTSSLPIIATKRGRLALLARANWSGVLALDLVLEEITGPRRWLAVEAPPASSLATVAGAFGAAFDALLVAERLGLDGRHSADDLLLERALLRDEGLLRAAVERELGQILGAPRNGEELLRTVETYLAARQNLRAAARLLGVGVRTVSYRLERVEALIGRPLVGDVVVRLSTALFARRLLGPDAPTIDPSGSPAGANQPGDFGDDRVQVADDPGVAQAEDRGIWVGVDRDSASTAARHPSRRLTAAVASASGTSVQPMTTASSAAIRRAPPGAWSSRAHRPGRQRPRRPRRPDDLSMSSCI